MCDAVDIAGRQVVFRAKLALRRAVIDFHSPVAPPIYERDPDWKGRSLRFAPVERLVGSDGAEAVSVSAPLTSMENRRPYRRGTRDGPVGAIRHEL
jgi:hypothetical protein